MFKRVQMLSRHVGERWGKRPVPSRDGGKSGETDALEMTATRTDRESRAVAFRAASRRISACVNDTTPGVEHLSERTGVAPDRAVYWDIRDVQFHCRIGRSTAWRLVREEGFPAPVVYGKRGVIWPSAEVIQFLEGRRDPSHYHHPAASRSPVPAVSQFAVRPVRRRRV